MDKRHLSGGCNNLEISQVQGFFKVTVQVLRIKFDSLIKQLALEESSLYQHGFMD